MIIQYGLGRFRHRLKNSVITTAHHGLHLSFEVLLLRSTLLLISHQSRRSHTLIQYHSPHRRVLTQEETKIPVARTPSGLVLQTQFWDTYTEIEKPTAPKE